MSIGVSALANYLSTRDNFWNYPPPTLSARPLDIPPPHVVMADAPTSRCSNCCGKKQQTSYQPFDDYLGLSKMLQGMSLTLPSDPIPMSTMGHRARLGSDGAELFDDFRSNGVDAELDDFDRIIHRLRSEDGSPTPQQASSSSGQSSQSASPASSSPPTITQANMAVLEILRERERRAAAAAALLAQQQAQLQQAAHQLTNTPSVLPPLPPVTTTTTAGLSPPGGRGGVRRARHGSGGSGGSSTGSNQTVCVFCRNNGEPVHVYTAHFLKDQTGRVTCPILRAYKCPYCRASGDNAHTKTYCPLAINALGEAPLSAERVHAKHNVRSSVGKKVRRPVTGTGNLLSPLHMLE